MRFVGTALVAGTIGVFFLLAEGGWIRAGTEGSTNTTNASTRKSARIVDSRRCFEQVVGKSVENVDGEKLGTIKDLILQRQTRQIQYVVVRSHGLIGRRRAVLVPVFAIALTTAKAGIASVDVSKQQWKRAPEFRKGSLALLGKPEQARFIARFYEENEAMRGLRNSQPPRLSSTGRGRARVDSQSGTNAFELASEVVGKN